MKSTLKKLSSIDNINQGGCGIAALAIHEKHKKGFFVRLFCGFFSRDCHVAIKLGDSIIDSNGITKIKDLRGYSSIEKMSKKELLNFVNDKEIWDKTFDRKNIELIEDKLGIKLKNVRR